MEYLRDPMGMTNSKVGYVYLVDENLKIRWAGCADATEKEAQSLESCTGVLLKRLEERVGMTNSHLNSSGDSMGESFGEPEITPSSLQR
jgi:ATPase complex subunit ATP10